MTTTGETPPTKQAPAPGRPYWNLDGDDKRVLYITVVGGLAVNIVTVMVVAVAIYLLKPPKNSVVTTFDLVITLLGYLSAMVAAYIGIAFLRRMRRRRETKGLKVAKVAKVAMIFFSVIFGAAALLLLLVLVGLAVRVK